MMGFSGVLGILLIAIILWAAIQFTNKYRSNNTDIPAGQEEPGDNQEALVILKKRFASGEISQLEYDRMEKDIS